MQKKRCFAIVKLINEQWFENEQEALPWVLSRKVLVNNQPITSLKELIPNDGIIRIKEYYKKTYVNKGGLKLEKALKDFEINVNNKVVLDCGASTGGFTDCMNQHGASLVYAVDVGFGQLASKLILNDKIINMERTNLSDEVLLSLSPPPEIICLDLSYLSLKKALPICKLILKDKGIVIALVKPIFEVESAEIRRTGEINDYEVLKDILINLCEHFINTGLNVNGITYSPVTGNNGTMEFFLYLTWGYNNLNNTNNSYNTRIINSLEKSFELHVFDKNSYRGHT